MFKSTTDSRLWALMMSIYFCAHLTGCSTLYYQAWESLGQEKRDLFRSQLSSTKDQQQEVEKTFASTLERIRHEYPYTANELDKTYDLIKEDYEDALAESEAYQARITKVNGIAQDLFSEWKSEAGEIQNSAYRQDSLNQLASSKRAYSNMERQLKSVSKKIAPVLSKMKDQMLYLKHRLNAQSLGILQKEMQSIEADIEKMLGELSRSIATTERYIETL